VLRQSTCPGLDSERVLEETALRQRHRASAPRPDRRDLASDGVAARDSLEAVEAAARHLCPG